tara:strand:- start:8387 stop:8542 length:156 start_codon:yes stop_codon:yes gene_type:complete
MVLTVRAISSALISIGWSEDWAWTGDKINMAVAENNAALRPGDNEKLLKNR